MLSFLNKIIMLAIKNKLLRPFQKLFNLIGLKLHITILDKKKNIHFFDKNIWLPFATKENYYVNLYNSCLKKTGKEWSNNLSKELRFFSLFQLAYNRIKRNNINNFAECGCWYGHSSLALSKILKENNFQGKFDIFDSFEGGLSDLHIKDSNLFNNLTKNDILKQKKAFSSSESFLKEILKDFEFVNINKGWIPSVFKKINNFEYQFVHIDVDLYQPTLDSLNFFYPKLIKEGIIVIDDYNLSQFPGAKIAVDEFILKNKVSFFYQIPFGGCFIVK